MAVVILYTKGQIQTSVVLNHHRQEAACFSPEGCCPKPEATEKNNHDLDISELSQLNFSE